MAKQKHLCSQVKTQVGLMSNTSVFILIES